MESFTLLSFLLCWYFFRSRFLCRRFFCSCFFLFLERIRKLLANYFLYLLECERLYFFELCDLLRSSFEIDILFSELDIWTIATILDRDFFFWPVMNIPICFFIDLCCDQALSFFRSDILEINCLRDIHIE